MPAKGGYEPPLPLLSDMKGGDSFKVFLFFPLPSLLPSFALFPVRGSKEEEEEEKEEAAPRGDF